MEQENSLGLDTDDLTILTAYIFLGYRMKSDDDFVEFVEQQLHIPASDILTKIQNFRYLDTHEGFAHRQNAARELWHRYAPILKRLKQKREQEEKIKKSDPINLEQKSSIIK